jgi:mannose-1-phosphate guanylyltransferase
MEKAENVFVFFADFGWSDLGTWGSVYEHANRDENGNSMIGSMVSFLDCNNCMIHNQDGKLIIAEGLDGFIVAETKDCLLIIRRENESKLRGIVEMVQRSHGEDFV